MRTSHVCKSVFLSFQAAQSLWTEFDIGGLLGKFNFDQLWSNLNVHVTRIIILDTRSKRLPILRKCGGT